MTISPALVNELRLSAYAHSDRDRSHHAIGRDDKSGDLFVIWTDGSLPRGWEIVATLDEFDGPGRLPESETLRCSNCGTPVTVTRVYGLGEFVKAAAWHTATGCLSCDPVKDGEGWCEPEGWINGRCAEVR